MSNLRAAIAAALATVLAAGCGGEPQAPGETAASAGDERTVRIERTTHGVAHITAPDYEALAYGVAYAHAADNVCQTANHLLTVRGERSRWFGPESQGLMGLVMLPNETIDVFMGAHMDDAALADAQQNVSAEAQALGRGYVAGYNRYLEDNAGDLPAACAGREWVRPMTGADYLRLQELVLVQIGVGLMADAVVAAVPPEPSAGRAPEPSLAEAVAALETFNLGDPGLGSNGWAFGADVTTNGSGVLLGNPHFPWAGANRFWQMHLTIPDELDVMGAAIGHTALVQIGFNHDVAWTHTVSTGKRFTLHELELVDGDPTRYIVDGEERAMTSRVVGYDVLAEDGSVSGREHTVWQTDFGPVVTVPRAGLAWDAERAYALQDGNTRNLRAFDIWVGLNRAESIADMRKTLGRLGVPWVNTIAVDRNGDAMYADVSVVPDVDAAQLERCAPSEKAAGLFSAAGLVVLDGSRSDCDWNRDPVSPVPGLTPIERMPVVVRRDWVQNSNDSYWMSNPAVEWPALSPLIGPVDSPQSLRTRSGVTVIRDRLAGEDGIAEHGEVGIGEVQAMLFANRSHAAEVVLDDLLAMCELAESADAQAGCSVLADWDRRNEADSRGVHLFREWWRNALQSDDLWRVPFDPANPVSTPRGLNDSEAARTHFLGLLEQAVATVRDAGVELDAPLGTLQRSAFGEDDEPLHGGPELEGVLNKLETGSGGPFTAAGYPIRFGTSYVQTVTFDERGPVAEALLTYGQSSDPASPHYFDQLPLFSKESWPELPFHREDIAAARIGEALELAVD